MLADAILRIALFLAPVYAANASPMLFCGKTPLDLNIKLWDNRKIFGEGKTVKGTAGGIFAGTLTAVAIAAMFPAETTRFAPNYAIFGFVVSLGAICGDLAGSFIKRRIGVERGTKLSLLDRLDFIAGSLLFGAVFFVPTMAELVAIVALTLILHRLSNLLAFKAKIKKVPW